MSFAELNLISEIQRAITEQGYTEATPIQASAIPAALARRDIMGCAQTGTGKTASFTLPLLQLLAPHANSSPSPARHPVRGLILTPTRELAAQVSESVKNYSKYLQLKSTVVYGGVDMQPQTKTLREGVDILIATPGRLLDHSQQKSVALNQVEILILDEADRMLDMGFLPDIRKIMALLPSKRQTLLFSATFSDDIKKLANQLQQNPQLIEVAKHNAPADLVDHQVYATATSQKRALLTHLIHSRDMKQVLVFLRMKKDCDKLSRELNRDGIKATAIHSDRTQAERELALQEFKEGQTTVLVATDIAARGIDIAELPFVINYELPYTPEDYVHRIGRTGRAGMLGEAISLVSPEEDRLLIEIERILKRKITRKDTSEFNIEPQPELKSKHQSSYRSNQNPSSESIPSRINSDRIGKSQRTPPSPSIAADGFDFNKPYVPKNTTIESTKPNLPNSIKPNQHQPQAALLGGFLTKSK